MEAGSLGEIADRHGLVNHSPSANAANEVLILLSVSSAPF